jgi:outer membrane protein insertion porin family
MHEFAYDGVIRHLASLTPTASLSIREAAGFSSKSSLSHTFTLDTRHDKILGTCLDRATTLATTPGAYFKVYQELAGLGLLGGDTKFYKGEMEAKAGFGVSEGLVSSFSLRPARCI